jgi:hypothetical protein
MSRIDGTVVHSGGPGWQRRLATFSPLLSWCPLKQGSLMSVNVSQLNDLLNTAAPGTIFVAAPDVFNVLDQLAMTAAYSNRPYSVAIKRSAHVRPGEVIVMQSAPLQARDFLAKSGPGLKPLPDTAVIHNVQKKPVSRPPPQPKSPSSIGQPKLAAPRRRIIDT